MTIAAGSRARIVARAPSRLDQIIRASSKSSAVPGRHEIAPVVSRSAMVSVVRA